MHVNHISIVVNNPSLPVIFIAFIASGCLSEIFG